MDEIIQFLEKWWIIITDFVKGLPPEQQMLGAAAIGVFLLLIIIRKITKRKIKPGNKSLKINEGGTISIESYQIAPLGRDAFLKIKNTGPSITLTQLTLANPDIHIKNALAGQRIDKGKVYSILLESKNAKEIPVGLQIEITYLNAKHLTEKQSFTL